MIRSCFFFHHNLLFVFKMFFLPHFLIYELFFSCFTTVTQLSSCLYSNLIYFFTLKSFYVFFSFASKESFHHCSFFSRFTVCWFFTSRACRVNTVLLLFSLHLSWKRLRLLNLAFKTEGINCNTKAADIVSHYSKLHIITMSSSVALFLDRCTQIICNNRISYFLFFFLRWKNNQHISDSCYIWSPSPPHN